MLVLASGLSCLRGVRQPPSLPPPVRVPRRTLQRHEEFEIPTFQLWASPNIPRLVHSTCGHDQHLITAISDANECPILPLGIQFRLSCTSRSNPHEVDSFSKFNQQSAVRLASMQFKRCASVTTNLIPQHPFPRVFHEKCQNGMSRRYFSFHSLYSNALFITLTCFCISRTVTSLVPFD